jgi:hypothetical protein
VSAPEADEMVAVFQPVPFFSGDRSGRHGCRVKGIGESVGADVVPAGLPRPGSGGSRGQAQCQQADGEDAASMVENGFWHGLLITLLSETLQADFQLISSGFRTYSFGLFDGNHGTVGIENNMLSSGTENSFARF